MFGLTDDLVAGVVATVDCHGAEHRLVVRDLALVALDHESEKAKVLDALSDEVPCLQIVAAWGRTLGRYADPGPDPYLAWLENLIPGDVTTAEHDEQVEADAMTSRRFQALISGRQGTVDTGSPSQAELARLLGNARASESVGRLPDGFRLLLGLLCAADAAHSGRLKDSHADRLTVAVTDCVASWRERGYPSAPSRVRVLHALRPIGSRPEKAGEVVQFRKGR